MASNRIKGITIEISGNTTKLTDSLKQVDKSLKDTQGQLKDVDKLLKMDPGNIDLLRQKQDLLTDAVRDTKTRQEELKKAFEQAKNSGNTEESQRQQDALQREIIETTKQLEDYENQLKKCNPALESFSTKAGQVAESTKKVSMVAAAAGAGMLAMAYNAGTTADDLLTMSNVTGFTVEELQKLKYASDLVDVSYESMTGSITKVTKGMASGSKAFETLGVSVTNADGSMRSATDVWYETIEALGRIDDETQRDVLSMEIFGKSAMEMAGIVDDGGAALKALGQEAEEAGVIMGGDAVASAGQFNDAIDRLKATAAASFAKAGATLAETLIPMLEKLVEIVSKVLEWFANLDGTTQTVILTILALVAAISPIASIIATISAAAAALNVAMLPMIGTIALIVAAVAAVIAIGVALYRNWDVIKEKASELWQRIKDIFARIGEAIMAPINKAKDFVAGTIEKIKSFFQFKVELPHIKLPHFGISPPGWKIGDLLKGSIPSLGIQWYAKAMDNGMILNSPTIFGAQNGRLLGAGEAGPEVVVGASSLYGMIKSATAGGGVTVNLTVNGNVEDYNELAEVIGQKLQQQMAREQRAF